MPHILIDDITPRVHYTVGGTPQSVFAAPFPFFEDGDLDVYLDGTLLTLTTDYTVTGEGEDDGGTVTLVTAVTNAAVAIVRNITIERVTDFPAAGPLVINSLNTDLDRIIAILQELDNTLARTVRLPEDEETSDQRLPDIDDRANRYAAWDADGDLIATSGAPPNDVPVSSFVEAALSASDLAGFFEALGWKWLDANTTVYVRADSTGNTGRDGSVDSPASAFLTWQAAWDYVKTTFFFNNFTVTIKMGDENTQQNFTNAAGGILSIGNWAGGGKLFIVGNTAAPDKSELTSTGADTIRLTAHLGGDVEISGFTLTCLTQGYLINNESTGHVICGTSDGDDMIYSDAATGHLACTWKAATMHVNPPYVVAGDADQHYEADSGLIQVNAGVVEVSGSRTFGRFTRVRNHGTLISLNSFNVTGVVAGQRFQVNENGFCNVETNGLTFFPGDSAGVAQTGGVYSGTELLQGLLVTTAADMEAATSALLPVVPSVMHRHPLMPKAWAFVTYSGGTPSLAAGSGFSASITDTGTGIARLTMSPGMSSSNYASFAQPEDVSEARTVRVSASVIEVRTLNSSGVATDSNFSVFVFGDQS